MDVVIIFAVFILGLAFFAGLVAVGAWVLLTFTSLSTPVAVLISFAFFALLNTAGR